MADNGWVKIHRKLTEKGYYKRSQYVHLWLHILLKANHKPKEFMWNKEIIIIKDGQILTGRKELCRETGISESSIENILKFFESEHQIGQQKTTKFRIITVINWKNYQIEKKVERQIGQQSNNRVTTDEQQNDTNKNDKNDKNDKKRTRALSPDGDFIDSLLNLTKPNLSEFVITSISSFPKLDNEDFKKVFTTWIDFRTEIKKPIKSEKTISQQLTFLSEQENPIAVINESIKNGWQGLFKLKDKNNADGTKRTFKQTGRINGLNSASSGNNREAEKTKFLKSDL